MSIHGRVLDPRNPRDLPKGLCALAVMTKVPRPGKVKTRLTPPLTPEEAAQLNRCFLSDTFASIANTSRQELARGVGVFTPLGAEHELEAILPEDVELLPQRGDAFDERLIFAMEDLFSLGFQDVCLIDSDSPTIPPDVFSQATQILQRGEEETIVVGPSEDGGYYLIGAKVLQRRLFQDIEWSTERVLEQTLERTRELDLKVQLLPAWYDIDDGVTLQRLCRELFGLTPRGGYPAVVTRAYLGELLRGAKRARIWPNEHAEE